MLRRARRAAIAVLVFCLPATGAQAQATQNDWWQDLDLFWTAPSGDLRLFGLVQNAKAIETSDRTLTLGLHVDDLAIPWGFARVGFRTIRSLEDQSAPEDRALAELTFPSTTGHVRFRNRTRLEVRWIGGEPSQRWRDRVFLGREFNLPRDRLLVPYTTYEVYWDSRYHALARTAYRLGSTITVTKHWEFDLSYARQDNRFGTPRHVNALWSRLGVSY